MIASMLFAMAAAAHGPAWAEFSRAGALDHVEERVTIATERVTRDTFDYRLTYTRETLRGRETRSTTSMACPAVRPILAGMRDLAMPHPAPYGIPGGSHEMVLDGTSYSLSAPSSFSNGKLTITSNIGSPLAAWVDGALKALEGCWQRDD